MRKLFLKYSSNLLLRTSSSSISIVIVKRNWTDDDRRTIYQHLLAISINGKVPRGSMTNATSTWNTSSQTIQNIWESGNECRVSSKSPGNIDSRIKYRIGRGRIIFHLFKAK